MTSTASGYSFSENGNYPYQSDNLNQTLQRKTARKEQFENGMILNIEINGQTFIQAGDKVSLEIGNTSTVTDEKDDVNLTGNYIVTHLRHSFVKSRQLKHQIIMQVAKDSRKGKPFAMEGIPDTNDFGPDKNLSKSIDVSAGYTAGSDFTVA